LLIFLSYSTVVISGEVRRIKCCRLLISHQQNRYIPVAKELLRSIQRLFSCCYNEEIALPMPTDPFNERFRLFSGGRSFDTQSSRCSQELCFILKRVGSFQCFLRSLPGQRLLSLCDKSLLSRTWWYSNQNEGGVARLCQARCLLQGLFSAYAAIK
jgi:hypothetical protein